MINNSNISLNIEQNNITPLPKLKLFIILTVLTSEMASLMYITPFLTFMIKSFNINEENIGYYSGVILSSYMTGQFFSNLFWGYLSEKIGIKPIILFGLLSSSICTILFGLSKSIIWAIFIRLLHGLLSGNLGVSRTYLYLITDKTNETKAFSLFPVAICIGAIIAPAIGGLLETPSKIWSNINGNHIFNIYPYLLPSIIISLLSFMGFILGLFFIKEPYKNNTENTEIETTTFVLNKNIYICIYLYFNIRLSLIGSDNLFPLLLTTSKKNNGLEFSPNNLAIVFMCSAVFLIIYSIIFIPLLKKYFGLLKLFSIVQIFNPLSIFCISLLSDFNVLNNTILSIISCIFFIIKSSFATLTVVLINLMINNSAEKKYLGRINGISQSFAALGSIIGPIVSGVLYSWSIKNDYAFPLDIHFSFIIFSIISFTNLLFVNFIDDSINNRIE